MRGPVRIANVSGFYGDRLSAAREMLDGPDPIDVLTGDYLAELTMLILWKARRKNASLGYAATFVRQMEETMGTCLERGIRVVSNAGGLGSLPCAMLGLETMRKELAAIRSQTVKPFNVNFFCHAQPEPDAGREAAWRSAIAQGVTATHPDVTIDKDRDIQFVDYDDLFAPAVNNLSPAQIARA